MKRFLPLSVVLLSAALYGQTSIQVYPYASSVQILQLDSLGQWEEQGKVFSADSGSFRVPENRLNAAARLIRLPLVRLKAEHPSDHPPVFWLSGGPGQTNMRSFRYATFIDSSDHVMVGYRGVDGEVSLDCPEIVEVLEEAGDILEPEVIRAMSDAYGSCAQRLILSGVDPKAYTPVEVARDIDAAREALGYEKITLVSESYGTRVAYYYALLFPERVHRMVMIGANPPGRMVWDPAQCDSLLQRYAELWKADPDISVTTPDLIAAIQKVHADFPRRWLFMPIHEGTVRASMNAFLFHRETAAQAFDVYAAAADGDASGLWLMSYIGGTIFPDIVNWGDNASKAMSSDFEPGHDYLHELMPEGAIFGAPLGAFLWSTASSGSWPYEPVDERFRTVQTCSVQTLFLSGSLDFSTFADNVEKEYLPRFPNGHHVVMSEAGHVADVWKLQPSATEHVLYTFLRTGEVDASKLRYVPMTFDVRWGFPFFAKLTVSLIGATFAVVVLVVRWVVRRVRNRSK